MIIKSAFKDYEVSFHHEVSAALGPLKDMPNVVTLVDAKVLGLYREVIEANLSGPIFPIEALETNKAFEKIGDYILQILNANCRKNSHLVVIGGGILQDIGGFIASVVFRGVAWTLVPTTLLAQCDSCIGSKTSLNISRFKNQLGTFYPPRSVRVASSFLSTLTEDDLKSGACEGIKLAMIEGESAVAHMRDPLKNFKAPDALRAIVKQSLEIKQVYIEEDEYDRGRRNILNYGHTFAHAIETLTDYAIPHGVAVGIGIEAAVSFSQQLGYVTMEHLEMVRTLLRPLTQSHVLAVKRLDASALIKIMKTDKKNTSGDITFILSKGFGDMFKEALPADTAERLLRGFLESGPERIREVEAVHE